MKKILILIPTYHEFNLLFNKLKKARERLYFFDEKIGCMTSFSICGIGEKEVSKNVVHDLNFFTPDFLMLLGSTGGVNDILKSGDFVIPIEICDSQNRTVIIGAPPYSFLTKKFNIKYVRSLTVPCFVDNSHSKELLRKVFTVDTVDMENYYVAKACNAHGIPYMIVRIVVDEKDVTIDSLESYQKLEEKVLSNSANEFLQIIKNVLKKIC